MNLWNLAISDTSFNIVDIKPTNMEELTEVITAASCHPEQVLFFIFIYLLSSPRTWKDSLTSLLRQDATRSRCCQIVHHVFVLQKAFSNWSGETLITFFVLFLLKKKVQRLPMEQQPRLYKARRYTWPRPLRLARQGFFFSSCPVTPSYLFLLAVLKRSPTLAKFFPPALSRLLFLIFLNLRICIARPRHCTLVGFRAKRLFFFFFTFICSWTLSAYRCVNAHVVD